MTPITKTQQRCICITAPTASGKTDLALALAAHFPIEIVSMDSAMVYRGMDIGTAKPSVEERGRVPHHLINNADPSERYSAGRFVKEARASIAEIINRQHIPLIVGGTMMYLRALRDGLAELPSAAPEIRAAIEQEAERHGWPALHAELRRLDATAAARIAPRDRHRIQRALEVHRATGRTLSEHLASQSNHDPLEVTTIALLPEDRAQLRTRIAERFASMLEAGFLAEVTRLRQRGDLSANLPAIRSVGYRQLWAYLDGEYPLVDAAELAITATRQLAKRQMTWLRSAPNDYVIEVGSKDPLPACVRVVAEVTGQWL